MAWHADWLAFGELRSSGRMIDIKEAARGLACDCVCPSCGGRLVARKGSLRAWHFAHAPGQSVCADGPETALHRTAKEIVAEWKTFTLHARTVVETLEDRFGVERHEEEGLPAETFVVRDARIEAALAGLRPDLLLWGDDDRQLAVEIRVTHRVDEVKQRRLQRKQIQTVELDLSALPREALDRAGLSNAIAEAQQRWIYHPDEEQTRRRLRARLRVADERRAPSRPTLAPTAGVPTESTLLPDEHRPQLAFDPWSGLIDLRSPPQRSQHLAAFAVRGVDVRIRSHELLGVITVWALSQKQNEGARRDVLRWLARDARDYGLRCEFRSAGSSSFLVVGEAREDWAKNVQERMRSAGQSLGHPRVPVDPSPPPPRGLSKDTEALDGQRCGKCEPPDSVAGGNEASRRSLCHRQ